jgi:antirestriction protein ArdC
VRDLYQEVTQRIVTELEKGVKPWTRPWKSTAHAVPTLPANLYSGRSYSGVNTLVLWLEAFNRGFPAHSWLTFQQAHMLGAHIRKGERGVQIVFAKTVEREKDGKVETIPTFRWFTVFNASQVDGLNLPAVEPPDVPEFGAMAQIRERAGVPVSHGHSRACYIPSQDRIEMPAYQAFADGHAYTRTLFHELAHATGHEKRLNRQMGKRFGDAAYAMEELVAELSSAFLCARIGSEYANENAEYIGAWVRKMKEDSRAIFTASSQAAKAADWLYDKSLEKEPERERELSY